MRITPQIPTILLLLFYSIGSPASPAENKLPISDKFSVHYILQSGLFTIGKTKRTLSIQEDDYYVFESHTVPAGMLSAFYEGDVRERSTWIYKDKTAMPVEYTFKDTNPKAEKDEKLEFDWDSGIVSNADNDNPWDREIEPGIQDKLLYQLSIMLDLNNNRERKTLNYKVADGRKLRTYVAEVQEKETIETPAGEFETLRITHDDGKRVTTLWCAPALEYLPVRIEHYRKGKTRVNAYLTKVKGLPQPRQKNPAK